MNNKKGMTLIEVIIALAIFAILTVMVTGVFTSSSLINTNAQEMNNSSLKVQGIIERKGLEHSKTNSTFKLEFGSFTVQDDIVKKFYKDPDNPSISFETFEVKN